MTSLLTIDGIDSQMLDATHETSTQGALSATEEQREEAKSALLEHLSQWRMRRPHAIKWLRDKHRMSLPDGDAIIAEMIRSGLIELDVDAKGTLGVVARRPETGPPTLLLVAQTDPDTSLVPHGSPEDNQGPGKGKETPPPARDLVQDAKRLDCLMQIQRWRLSSRKRLASLKESLKHEKERLDDLDTRLDRIAEGGDVALDLEVKDMPSTKIGQARPQTVPGAEDDSKGQAQGKKVKKGKQG